MENDESQTHVYKCPVLMKENIMSHKITPEFESIFTKNTRDMKIIQQIYMKNMEIRKKYTKNEN